MSTVKTFKFGIKSGEIAQLGFGVPDVEKAIDIYMNQLHIGPWQISRNFISSPENTFRGAPNPPAVKTNATAW